MKADTVERIMLPGSQALLLDQLQRAFDRRSWHGSNLMGSLKGVDRTLAVWRPQPGRHNIAEYVLHAAYWKYRLWRLLSGSRRRAFELAGSNFFPRSNFPSEAAWRADLELLRRWHRELVAALAALPAAALDRRPGRQSLTRAQLVMGAAAHDLYHAGQIQLIKRLRTGCV